MNILLFSPFSGSSQHGMPFRNYALAREWVRQGHDVTIVASSFSHTRSRQPSITRRITEQYIDGVRFLWIWGPKYRQSKTLGRVLSMFFYILQCMYLKSFLPNSCDVVIASSPHPFAIYPAYKAARFYNAKLIYDIRDLWPLTLVLLGRVSSRHPFIRLMQLAEDFACRHADLVTSVPGACEGYLKRHGLPSGRFLHVGNGAVLGGDLGLPLGNDYTVLLKNLRARECFILGYAGAVGVANAMGSIVEAIKLTSTEVHLVILGDGSEILALKKLAESLDITEKIHFLQPINRSQVKEFLDLIDVAFAGTQHSELYKYGASLTKVNDYMMAGKPILYAVGDLGNSVEISNCGICCKAEDSTELAHSLDLFYKMTPSELQQMGQRGKDWCIEHQLVSQQAARILEILDV